MTAQFAFGVSPGINLNGASFGYQFGNSAVGYIGLQYLGAHLSVEDSGEPETEVSASILSPTIGLKYFAFSKNKLKGYFNASLSKPIFAGKLKTDGEEDPDFKESIRNSNSLGFEIGFGVEYFFDGNFSIGGEYGFRNLSFKYADDADVVIKARVSPTYTRFCLNYYFGGPDSDE